LIGIALIPWRSSPVVSPRLNETAVLLHTPSNIVFTLPQLPGRSGGGGGGGKRESTKASRGVLPRGTNKQLAPPDPNPPKNPDPQLIVEPTIVAPQLARLRPLTLLNLGDPNGGDGPPSSGTGDGGGIGNRGKGRGVGDSDGPGTGPGKDDGCCGGNAGFGGII